MALFNASEHSTINMCVLRCDFHAGRYCHAHCLLHSNRHNTEDSLLCLLNRQLQELTQEPHLTNQNATRGSHSWLKSWWKLRMTELQGQEANESRVLPLGTAVPKHFSQMTAQLLGKQKIFMIHFSSLSHCLNLLSFIKYWKQYGSNTFFLLFPCWQIHKNNKLTEMSKMMKALQVGHRWFCPPFQNLLEGGQWKSLLWNVVPSTVTFWT